MLEKIFNEGTKKLLASVGTKIVAGATHGVILQVGMRIGSDLYDRVTGAVQTVTNPSK